MPHFSHFIGKDHITGYQKIDIIPMELFEEFLSEAKKIWDRMV